MTKQREADRTSSQEWPPEVRAEWLEAKKLNAARLGRETAQSTLLGQVSGTMQGPRPSHIKILD